MCIRDSPNRGNSGYLLECSESTILLDGGSGTLRRIADFGLDYSSIDIICYTHLHIDHTFDLIPFLFNSLAVPDVAIIENPSS